MYDCGLHMILFFMRGSTLEENKFTLRLKIFFALVMCNL